MNEKTNEFLLKQWRSLRRSVGLPTLTIIALIGSYFLYAVVRDWRLEREVELQNKRIEQYTKQSNEAMQGAERHLLQFQETHRLTLNLLEVVENLSDNVSKLSEKDRIVETKVSLIGEKYEKTRNVEKVNIAVQPDISLDRREDRALSADRELYPNE